MSSSNNWLCICLCALFFPFAFFAAATIARLLLWFWWQHDDDDPDKDMRHFWTFDTAWFIGGIVLLLFSIVVISIVFYILQMTLKCIIDAGYYVVIWPLTWPYRRYQQRKRNRDTNEQFLQFSEVLITRWNASQEKLRSPEI